FGVSAAMLQSIAIFSVNFLLIFYLEGIYNLSVLEAAILIMPSAIAVGVVGPFGGILSDRFGARRIATIGLLLQIAALFALAALQTGTPLWTVGALEAIFGVGSGLFFPANTSTIMSASPQGRYGVGSGIMNTFRNTGMVLSFAVSLIAITTTLSPQLADALFVGVVPPGGFSLADQSEYLSGQSLAFLIAGVLLVVALILVLWTKDRAPTTTPAYEVTSVVRSKPV
ncbi:MAG: MFS transporter, partial [Thermoplasmata archaeon]